MEQAGATEKSLQAIKARVNAGKLAGADAIGLRVGKVVNQYKVAKHFTLAIADNSFTFARKHEAIAAEAALDGIYIIRTSVDATRMEAADCVRNYKALAHVERAFRSLKTSETRRCARSTTAQPSGCARTSCCACSRTTWSGTCAKLGAS